MSCHHFNINIAQKFSVEEAIFLASMEFWIRKNAANERHIKEGRIWTYNSVPALNEIFPYWSPPQIKRLIAKLIKNDLILKKNFNIKSYDRTSWYAFTERAIELLGLQELMERNRQIDRTKSSHRSDEIVSSVKPGLNDPQNDDNPCKHSSDEIVPPIPDTKKTSLVKKLTSEFFTDLVKTRLLDQKLDTDHRSDEEFLENCADHVLNHSDKKYPESQRINALVILLRKLKTKEEIFFSTNPNHQVIKPTKKQKPVLTEQENDVIARYNHAKRTNQPIAMFVKAKELPIYNQAMSKIEALNAH